MRWSYSWFLLPLMVKIVAGEIVGLNFLTHRDNRRVVRERRLQDRRLRQKDNLLEQNRPNKVFFLFHNMYDLFVSYCFLV